MGYIKMIDKYSFIPLLLSTLAGLSTVIGAIIVFFNKTKNEKFLTFSLGFSAGVMITVSFTDLFPTAEESISKYHGEFQGVIWSILFLLIGGLIAFLIETRLSFIQIEANLVDFDVTLNTESINLCNMTKITVKDAFVSVIKINDEGYISLTDMLKAKGGDFFFSNWLRNRNTVEFLVFWEN